MFYSHTFLAKKSPLGTVWIAAHLQRRIKKPQIDVIDIPSYADSIMFPEVPIALRLSGHLLLGLVRIYSWKVNYLLQDCNRMRVDIKTVLSTVHIDLPKDVDRAPVESVTLPPMTFELDTLNIDGMISQMDGQDKYVLPHEEITMIDDIPADGDAYVAFYIREDDNVSPSPNPAASNQGPEPMDEDILPPFEGDFEVRATPVGNNVDFGDFGTSNQANASVQGLNEGHLPEENPHIEVMREAPRDFEPMSLPEENPDIEVMREAPRDFEPMSLPEFDVTNNDSVNTNNVLSGISEHSASIMNEKRAISPIKDNTLVQESLPSITQHPLPELEQPSPPAKKQKRKRKCFFDETSVLKNVEMEKQLQDTSKLVHKRRKAPCSALDAWRFNLTLKNDFILNEPIITGMFPKLRSLFKKSYPLRTFDSISAPSQGPANAPSVDVIHDTDMEPELPRFDSHILGNHPEPMASPSVREDATHLCASKLSTLASTSDVQKLFDTEVLPTLDLPTAEPASVEPETPFLPSEEQHHLDDSAVPECPGLLNSAKIEELDFLEESNTSSGSEPLEVGTMSARTRAVARYFKDHSPATGILQNQSVDFSLNRILQGKKRKQCARMFFETTVLKTYDFIDVKQAEAYGDIIITPTRVLAAAKF